ncbi:MAG TPA: nucleoside hydrolase [Pedobacter sp.]|nr:nucleoside hydrolase [Pedobacter sp.]
MKKFKIYYPLLGIGMLLTGSWSMYELKPEKGKALIIFDTDMGPDYDDVGAIAVLHALAKKGECEILATLASDSHPSIAPTITLFNQYFGRPEIPVGFAPPDAPGFTASNNWNDSLITRFFNKQYTRDYLPAVTVYREVLAKQADNSVTIVTVGFVSNISALLKSQPDKFSKLSGIELVRKKVKNWVAMAGGFPQGREFNVEQDAAASFEAFAKWPKPILFSGFEIGQHILTGARVAQIGTDRNPVAWAYRYNLKTYDKQVQANRPSWDQTAVLCAVRGPERYFYVNGPGKFVADRQGANTWEADGGARHYFLSHKYPFEKIAKAIEDLMMEGQK